MGQGPKGQGGRGGTPELISANEKPKKTGPLSPAGKQDCPSLAAEALLAEEAAEVAAAGASAPAKGKGKSKAKGK